MADPYSTNPYLQMPQQEAPSPWMALANLATGIGTGISQGAASGRGWASGLAPGIMYGNQLTGLQQQNAQQQAMKRWQLGMMAQDWQSKQEERREKTALAKAAGARDAGLGSQIATLMGLSAPPSAPQMGPNFNAPAPDRDAFVQTMMPHALEVSKATGLDPRLVIAQAANETGWGKSAPGNNYFGIKAAAGQPSQMLDTWEVGPGGERYQIKAPFRTFADPGASAQAYAEFLKANPRYAPVMAAQGLDAQIDAMGKSGYATDPQYGAKLRQIAQSLPGGPPAQGDAIAGQGDAPVMPQNAIASLPAEVRAGIAAMAQKNPEKALQMMVQAVQEQQKEGAWEPLDARNKQMFPNLDPTKDYLRNRRTGDIKPIGGSLVTVNTGDKLLPGQKKVDEKFADQYIEFVSAGGFADSAKMLDQLKEVQTALKSGANLTGPLIGMQGDTLLSFTNPNAMAMRDAVFEVAQRNLRVVLGAQFTAKEGEQLIARTYNPRLSEEENAKRIDRLMDQIKTSMEAKIDSAKYFEEHGTLRGWKGKLPKLSDFEPAPIPESKAKTDRPPISSFGRDSAPTATPTQRPPLSSFGR